KPLDRQAPKPLPPDEADEADEAGEAGEAGPGNSEKTTIDGGKREKAPGERKKTAADGDRSSPAEANGEGVEDEKYRKVKVEEFRLEKDQANRDLMVRFDIRNVSDNPGTISGRIFVILKPELGDPANWLVMPSVPLKNGKPAVPSSGQFFSIAHFKPVKFRVASRRPLELFQRAEVYVYGEDGSLMFQRKISISGKSGD
ncbi:MAG TPA: hypothetical protein VJ936_06355, partial [Desulfobacteraceae bacterium]|nr:hypothetical protein [Desulfobacteraceae bacterium]